jgi:hypothetical protein
MTTFTKVTLIAAAAVVATLALPATADADTTSRYQFLSPSGNIACQMDQRGDGTADAWCKIREHTWVEPESGDCEVAYLPGAIGEPAPELQLSQGNAPCLGFVMSQIFFSGPIFFIGQGMWLPEVAGPHQVSVSRDELASVLA